MEKNNQESVILAGTMIDGVVTGKADLRIEGEIKGQINLDGTLVIASTGVSESEILADNVIIEGSHSTGNVSARECIKIAPEGCVKAELKAPAVSIEKGARFSGQIDMTEAE